MRLDKEEYMPYAPDEPGRPNRVNHNSGNCAGDSLSLSVWRNNDGSVGAKCYRCGGKGRADAKGSMFKKTPKKETVQEMPTDIVFNYEDMPPEIATYLSGKGMTEALCFHYGVGWSPSLDGLILPVHNELHHDGFQIKYFDRDQRYSTVHRGNRELMFSHLCDKQDVAIIVEDLISAIRVKESTGYDAFALLGSEINDHGLSQILRFNQEFVVWLDNDNDIICSKAKALYNRLSLFGRCRYIKDQCEPKDISDLEIKEILHKKSL